MGKKQRVRQEKRKKVEMIRGKVEPVNKNSDPLDLFDNELTRAAMKALSPEQLENYKEIGRELYNNVNFEHAKILNNLPPPLAEGVAYVEIAIKSGMHISLLDGDEKQIMSEAWGEKWYEKFGFVKEDLDKIVTLVN